MTKVLFETFSHSRLKFLLVIFLSIGSGLTAPFILLYEKELLDSAIYHVAGVIPPLIILALIYILKFILPVAISYFEEMQQLTAQKEYKLLLARSVQKCSYEKLESAGTMNLIKRLYKDIDANCLGTLKSFFDIISIAVSLIGYLILIFRISLAIGMAYFFFFIVLYFLCNFASKAFHFLNIKFFDIERKVMYFDEVLNTKKYASEKKLFKYTDYVNEKRRNFLLKQRNAIRKNDYKFGLSFALIESFSYISVIISLVLLLPGLTASTISISMFVAMARALLSLNLDTQNKLRYLLEDIGKQRLYWKDYFTLCDPVEEEQKQSLPVEVFHDLKFINVCFQYPNGTKVLDNLNLEIENGKHYALVGENGAGKSTLIKLMLGLYRPDSGRILLNGQDIAHYSEESLHRVFSVIFQDFEKFYISMKENILLGKEFDENKMNTIIDQVGLRKVLDKRAEGLDTPLGPLYKDSTNLSGGEWQKVALARALYQTGEICILDEPTSNLDPILESKIYSEYDKLIRGRTSIFISHRLASTKLANVIFVLGEGKIIEKGSHSELMELNGIYKIMFESQREWYEETII